MATVKLGFTKRNIEALKPPKADRQYVYDTGQANLALCITAAGNRTFYRIGRVNRRPIRYRLGTFPELSVETARKMARAAGGEIAKGKDPHADRLAHRHEQTLTGLFNYWLENHAKPRKRTWADDERMFNKYIKGWHSRRLSLIRQGDVESLHSHIGKEHGPYQANRVLALLRSMFAKASKMGFKGANPCDDVERFPEQTRDRFLQPEELPKFFAALNNEEPVFRDLFMVALLTGARRGNVQAMRWDELRLEAKEWRIPRTKNADPLIVHLADRAAEILLRRQSEANGSPWVFPGGKKNRAGHISSPKLAWKRVLDAAGLSDLRMHDLRRTLGSWQAIAGASLPIIGASLGHRSQQATAIYARLSNAPVVDSVNQATSAILAAAEPTPTKQRRAK